MKRIIILLILLSLSACARNDNIPAVPPGMQPTKLGDIISNPSAYDGKNVLLIGSVADFCATSGCHFTFQDSGKTIDLYPKGFNLPKLRKGQALKVYAEVKAGEVKTVISALGLEVK